jgi:hypothetical protein
MISELLGVFSKIALFSLKNRPIFPLDLKLQRVELKNVNISAISIFSSTSSEAHLHLSLTSIIISPSLPQTLLSIPCVPVSNTFSKEILSKK